MAKIPNKFKGLLGRFAESFDYKDLPTDWADNPEIVEAAGELYRDMGTESPFFKAWFGNSKVVDPKGKPLTTYHQTDQNFDTFNLSKARQNSDIPAFFFSSGTEDWSDMGGRTIPAYLRIQNPTSKPPAYGRGREVREGLEGKGYDGTIEMEDGLETEYAAFNPNQIKSTSNRGTFNPDDPNIYRALPWAVGGAGAAAALAPDEAEAAPRPKYMEELVEKLKSGDYTPMDFGNISGGQLKKLQSVDPAFTEGPLKLSGKNIEKFAKKRMGLDHIEPETLVDGLNSVFHGSRSRAFPDGRGAAKLFMPDGEYAWRGVVAPHDGFSGLVTGYRYPVEDMKKELSLPSEGRPFPSYPHIPEEVASKEGTLPGRLTTVEDKEKLFDDSNIPAIETIRKGMLPLFIGGGAALAPGEAQASVPVDDYRARAIPADQYPWPADEPGFVAREPGLGTPLVDVADLVTAPIGAATTAGRAAAVAAEPFVAYGMDKAGGWLGDKLGGMLGYFGWGD